MQIRFEDFQDGHLRYLNRIVLAFLNLYVTLMPPIKFGLNPVWEDMSFKEFQNGGHLGCQNETNLTVLNFHVSQLPPNKFELNLLTIREQKSFQDSHTTHGGHLGYWKGKI